MLVWIGCAQFHEIGIWTTYKLMHKHLGKRAKMQRRKKGQMKASKASISTSHRVEKVVNQAHQHHRVVSHKWSHPNKPSKGQM